MEVNHILIILVAVILIGIVAYFMTKPKFYKETTVYLYFETKESSHDRVIFLREGLDNPEDLLAEIDKHRSEIEIDMERPAILRNIKIFSPQWKI